MRFEAITEIVAKMGAMKFFPGDVDSRLAIAEALASMAATEDQARWVVKRALAIYPEWPGLHELRACFCSKFKPADGIEVYSTVFVEGIPAERESFAALNPPPVQQLSAGESVLLLPEARKVVADPRKQMGPIRSKPIMREGETEYAALARTASEPPQRKPPRSVTPEEIAAIKRQQIANAEKEETRAILADEPKEQAG